MLMATGIWNQPNSLTAMWSLLQCCISLYKVLPSCPACTARACFGKHPALLAGCTSIMFYVDGCVCRAHSTYTDYTLSHLQM